MDSKARMRKNKFPSEQRSHRRRAKMILLGTVAVGSAAFAQDIPDTMYSLGLNPRGEGMGGAVTALSYDPSATLYNPASLAIVRRRDAMLVLRTQPQVDTLLGGQATDPIEVRDPQAGNIGFGMIGITLPFGAAGNPRGTLGVSYARIGHYEESLSGRLADPGTGNVINRNDRRKIDTDLITIAYGFSPGNRGFNLGAGLVIGQQRFDFDYRDEIEGVDIDPIVSNLSETGTGVGFIVGVEVPGPQLTYGASYRSEINLSGQGAFEDYSDTIPARLAAGAAYVIQRTGEPEAGTGTNLIGAADVEHYFSANSGLTDRRRSYTNFHVGLEYTLYLRSFILPVRVGYNSNQAGNTSLFSDTSMLTVGVGYRPLNDRFGVDVSLGFGENNATSTIVGFVYRFDR